MLDLHQSERLLSQLQVEQATGLSREVLRKWELRYGFPLPQRGTRGQRLYSAAVVQQLHWLQKILRQGMRPATALTLPQDKWQALAESAGECAADSNDLSLWVNRILDSLAPDAPLEGLREGLLDLMARKGLGPFAATYFPALNTAVGVAWAKGQLAVYAEHRYSETMRELLGAAASKLAVDAQYGRALLTTPPGELHGLGLLGLQAALGLKGVQCVMLGTQTPVEEVSAAARDIAVRVVAISASNGFASKDLKRYLKALRAALPAECALWAGGQGCSKLSGHPVDGVHYFSRVVDAVEAWPV